MPAKFIVKQSPKKGFRWNLVATNGRVIATSQFFETRRAAIASIASARKNAPAATVVDAESEAKKPAKAGKPGKGKPSRLESQGGEDHGLKTRH